MEFSTSEKQVILCVFIIFVLLLPHFNLCQYRLWLDLTREEIGLTKARFDMERKEKGRVYSRGRTRME